MKMPNMPFLIGKDNLDESTFCNESHLLSNDIDCTTTFCECTHVLQVKLNSVVELIMIDEGFTYDANHPFHLHGHSFRVLAMERVSSNVTVDQVSSPFTKQQYLIIIIHYYVSKIDSLYVRLLEKKFEIIINSDSMLINSSSTRSMALID